MSDIGAALGVGSGGGFGGGLGPLGPNQPNNPTGPGSETIGPQGPSRSGPGGGPGAIGNPTVGTKGGGTIGVTIPFQQGQPGPPKPTGGFYQDVLQGFTFHPNNYGQGGPSVANLVGNVGQQRQQPNMPTPQQQAMIQQILNGR